MITTVNSRKPNLIGFEAYEVLKKQIVYSLSFRGIEGSHNGKDASSVSMTIIVRITNE